jgi:hypothetical protein
MNKVLTIVELLRRVRRKHELAAFAMAALLFLLAMPATATAQDFYDDDFKAAVTVLDIGLVPGQTLVISVPNPTLQDGSVKVLKASINVYDRESGLVYSGESGSMQGHELGHIFTIRHGDLPVPGEPRTGRKQVWIEVESTTFTAPTFDLVDDASGRTVLMGLLLPAVFGDSVAHNKTDNQTQEGERRLCTD